MRWRAARFSASGKKPEKPSDRAHRSSTNQRSPWPSNRTAGRRVSSRGAFNSSILESRREDLPSATAEISSRTTRRAGLCCGDIRVSGGARRREAIHARTRTRRDVEAAPKPWLPSACPPRARAPPSRCAPRDLDRAPPPPPHTFFHPSPLRRHGDAIGAVRRSLSIALALDPDAPPPLAPPSVVLSLAGPHL